MNSLFQTKFLQHLNKKNSNKGFTLIELLVVVIIIGVLAAIALPNLLNQVAKGRQAEAKNNLGAINRAQQAYRLEKATFGAQGSLPISVTGQYYVFSGGDVSQTLADHIAVAGGTYNNDIRDYGSAVSQDAAGAFAAIICEGDTPNQASIALNTVTGTATCPTAYTQVN